MQTDEILRNTDASFAFEPMIALRSVAGGTNGPSPKLSMGEQLEDVHVRGLERGEGHPWSSWNSSIVGGGGGRWRFCSLGYSSESLVFRLKKKKKTKCDPRGGKVRAPSCRCRSLHLHKVVLSSRRELRNFNLFESSKIMFDVRTGIGLDNLLERRGPFEGCVRLAVKKIGEPLPLDERLCKTRCATTFGKKIPYRIVIFIVPPPPCPRDATNSPSGGTFFTKTTKKYIFLSHLLKWSFTNSINPSCV